MIGAITIDQKNMKENLLKDHPLIRVDDKSEYCTFTNNEGTVLSDISIFETLWENAMDI